MQNRIRHQQHYTHLHWRKLYCMSSKLHITLVLRKNRIIGLLFNEHNYFMLISHFPPHNQSQDI